MFTSVVDVLSDSLITSTFSETFTLTVPSAGTVDTAIQLSENMASDNWISSFCDSYSGEYTATIPTTSISLDCFLEDSATFPEAEIRKSSDNSLVTTCEDADLITYKFRWANDTEFTLSHVNYDSSALSVSCDNLLRDYNTLESIELVVTISDAFELSVSGPFTADFRDKCGPSIVWPSQPLDDHEYFIDDPELVITLPEFTFSGALDAVECLLDPTLSEIESTSPSLPELTILNNVLTLSTSDISRKGTYTVTIKQYLNSLDPSHSYSETFDIELVVNCTQATLTYTAPDSIYTIDTE